MLFFFGFCLLVDAAVRPSLVRQSPLRYVPDLGPCATAGSAHRPVSPAAGTALFVTSLETVGFLLVGAADFLPSHRMYGKGACVCVFSFIITHPILCHSCLLFCMQGTVFC